MNSLYGYFPDWYGPAGNAAVLRLRQDDVVYVRVQPYYDYTLVLHGSSEGVSCTFSGYLIQPLRLETVGENGDEAVMG